jgi:hypothetical protein
MPTAFTVANSPLTSNGTIAVSGAGTSSQFIKGDGTLDSTAYGTGSVTSVALTMPTAFSVANSPVTTAGTLAVTATGTTSQYIRGDGTLETFPALTGFVPYTGATADVNLGTFDLLAERGTFENNGSSNTLTVNHTSGSGYGIIVTKGGNNEALYVSKTSGSGNAMTVVGGRTSLVDLALSSVTNTAGDFLTLSGGVVHKRTAAQTLTDIGGQAALTNPVTGTGTTNYLPKFTGASTIGDSVIADNATEINIPKRIFLNSGGQSIFFTPNLSSASNRIEGSSGVPLEIFTSGSALRFAAGGVSTQITLLSSGNVGIGTTAPTMPIANRNGLVIRGGSNGAEFNLQSTSATDGTSVGFALVAFSTDAYYINRLDGNHIWATGSGGNTERMRIWGSSGNVNIGPTPASDAGFKLDVNGTGRFSGNLTGISANFTSNVTIGGNDGAATRLYVRTEDTANTPSLTLFKNVNTSSTEDIFRVQSFSGGIVTTASIRANGSATFSSNVQGKSFSIVGPNGYSGQIIQQGEIFGTAATNLLIQSGLGNGIGFLTNGGTTFNMFITSGGNVGIGTSSPNSAAVDRALTVSGTSNSIIEINYGSTRGGYFFTNSINTVLSSVQSVPLLLNTSDIERMRITSIGSIGFNTSTVNRDYVFSNPYNRGAGGFEINAADNIINFLSYNRSTNAYLPISLSEGSSNVLIGTSINGASRLRIVGLPTSASGLSSGDVWNDGGTLKIA